MFVLTLNYGPSSTIDSFFFKTEDAAKAAFDSLIAGENFLSDDFGSYACISGELHSLRVGVVETVLEAQIEQTLAQQRAQAKAQQRVQADPLLKFAQFSGGRMAPVA